MLSKEIKQLIELSNGKLIISEGKIEESYVVMKLDNHLKELKDIARKDVSKESQKSLKKEVSETKEVLKSGLTRDELLDRINTDIAEMKRINTEKEIAHSFKSEDELKESEDMGGKREFYYEKVH